MICTFATIGFRLILAKFRPNSDQKYTETQTKFRPVLNIFTRNSDLQRHVHLMLFQLHKCNPNNANKQITDLLVKDEDG